MILLVDNSNTRTKFMLLSGEDIEKGELTIIPTAELTPENILDVAKSYTLTGAVIASVVPRTAELLKGVLHTLCPVCVLHAQTAGLPIQYDYPGVATLGADRVANIVAVSQYYPLPCVAIDAGTAITFDVVVPTSDHKPCYVGGAIAPGINTMLASLNQQTSLLPHIRMDSAVPSIGKNTCDAIQVGVHWGVCGLVERVLRQIEVVLGSKPCVIVTGGDAAKIASSVSEIDGVDELLTFRGLQRVANLCL